MSNAKTDLRVVYIMCVILGELSRLVEEGTKYTLGGRRDMQFSKDFSGESAISIPIGLDWHGDIGAITFYSDRVEVCGATIEQPSPSSAFYCDPDFFDKIVKFVKDLND